jgi:hypothetical protein
MKTVVLPKLLFAKTLVQPLCFSSSAKLQFPNPQKKRSNFLLLFYIIISSSPSGLVAPKERRRKRNHQRLTIDDQRFPKERTV